MCAIRFLCHPLTPSRGQLPRAFLPTSKIPKGRYDQPAQTHPFRSTPCARHGTVTESRLARGLHFGVRHFLEASQPLFLARAVRGREGIPQGTLANAKGSGALLTIPLLNLVARSLAALRR
jgi:hypothetical protein